MASRRLCSLLYPLIACILLLVSPAMCDSGTEELIAKICHQMEEFGYCNTTFHDNIGSPSADLKALTQITIEQSIINATNSHFYAAMLLKDAPEGPYRYALMACENAYALIIRQFQEASTCFNNGVYQDVQDAERILPRAIASCTS